MGCKMRDSAFRNPVRSRPDITQNWGYEVSGNYFDMLGIHPEMGRFFHLSSMSMAPILRLMSLSATVSGTTG